jgi:predicted kinase
MVQPEERIIRVIRPSIVVLCGPAACGKSNFAVNHFRPTQVISSDACRAMVCDDERDQRYHAQTFALLEFLVSQRLSINRLCVVDSTALAPGARKSLLKLGRNLGVRVELFMFDIPLAKCLEMDSKRERSVGPKVIEEHYQLFQEAQSSVGSEGFDQITDLHEDDLQSVKIEILYRPTSRPAQESGPKKAPPYPGAPGRGSRS